MGVGAIAAGLFFGVVCLAAGRKFSGASRGQARFALWASLLFLGAYVFRIVLGYTSEGFTTDTDTFKSWAALANSVGFGQIYHQDIFLDYPPGYLSTYWRCWTSCACSLGCPWKAPPTRSSSKCPPSWRTWPAPAGCCISAASAWVTSRRCSSPGVTCSARRCT